MNDAITLKTGRAVPVHKSAANKNADVCSKKESIVSTLKSSASLIIIAAMFAAGSAIALLSGIPVKSVMSSYSYDVLVILIVMELFTDLIAETGIIQLLAVKAAEISKGRKRMCLVMFGSMMFLISSCLNNITAVMMILPVIFVLLRTLECDGRYINIFFAALLALSNTGGAASPVGDFPAIIIMTSGITTFLGYLSHAFPLFALTSAALIALWSSRVKKEKDDGAIRGLAVLDLKSQYKNIEIRYDVLKWLAVIFAGMFLAWSFVPQDIMPPEMIAVLGYAAAMIVSAAKKIKVCQLMDLRSLLTIASFLFFASVISATGVLDMLAGALQHNIADPKLLVIAIMAITSLVAGIFSAGPAAAAMMPVITEICSGPLSAQSDWIAVAYAAAVCAGSSLFMWSATAGFILSGKVNEAGIEDERGKSAIWGVTSYMKYGMLNYAVQLTIAIAVMFVVL